MGSSELKLDTFVNRATAKAISEQGGAEVLKLRLQLHSPVPVRV